MEIRVTVEQICSDNTDSLTGNHHHHNHHSHYHHFHHLSLNRKSRWGTTDDFTTSYLHFSVLSTALWDLANSRLVHSLMLSSHVFLCLPCLLPSSTVPCKMVLARPDEQETWPYRAQNADTHALKEHRLSQNIFPVCSSFVLVIAPDMHLEPESDKWATNVDFHTAKNIQIQPTLFSFLCVCAIFRRIPLN